ncbi:MAG: hypothetical protein Q8941_04365 [Bacteroidota bacterium]|nr:hypothetical protein [Bacteroidota bacterium]
MKILISFVLLYHCLNSNGQSKPFVPVEYEYPAAILKTPKTYIYSKAGDSSLSFRDVIMTKKPGQIIINSKEYDQESISDSSVEINDKDVEHYLFMNGKMIKGVSTEDSVHNNGSRLGEKVQSEFFKIDPSYVWSATFRSRFLKDTSITWDRRQINCLVIETNITQVITDTNDSTFKKQGDGKVIYYFGKEVGLIRCITIINGTASARDLKQIKELKE